MRGRRLGTLLALLLACSLAVGVVRGSAAVDRPTAVRHATFPFYADAVPVLLYHRLYPTRSAQGGTPVGFDVQMQRLHELGFEAISLDQYVRFIRGDAVNLPPRPILITFDDGDVSSWAIADPVLARYGWTAAMYIPTGAVGRPGRLTWAQLRGLQATGRWQIDEHAGDGHVVVPVDAAGHRLPFYAAEMWNNGVQESFAHYEARTSRDVGLGRAVLAEHIPGWTSHDTFAVPFGDYGQRGSVDPRIEPWFSSYLKARFAAIFVQRNDSFTTPGPGFKNRITASPHWDGATLESHLLGGLGLLRSAARGRAAPGG